MIFDESPEEYLHQWILANTSIAKSLNNAWEEYCKKMFTPDDKEQDIKKKEAEVVISALITDIWKEKLEQVKQKEIEVISDPIRIYAKCTNYNVLQMSSKDLELDNVDFWKLSLSDCTFIDKNYAGLVQCQAIQESEQKPKIVQLNKKKKKQNKIKKQDKKIKKKKKKLGKNQKEDIKSKKKNKLDQQ